MSLNNRLGVPDGNWFEFTGEPRPVQNIGVAFTASVLAGDALEADNCIHCHASYGHTILCPILNRNTAEAISTLNGNATERDAILAHALGVKL